MAKKKSLTKRQKAVIACADKKSSDECVKMNDKDEIDYWHNIYSL